MKIQKCISGLLVFFFLTNSVFAQVPLSVSPAPKFVDLKSPAADIHIPAEFGSVQRNSPGAGPVVIHVADAHAHYEAQIQIKNILDHLIRTYSIRLVGVEGASSTLRPEIFRLFSDKKVNSSVVDLLVKQGELSGAEFLAIQDDSKNAPVWTGVEDKELYLKDLAAFRSVWNQYEAKKDFFEKQKIEIAKLKARVFSEELRKFDEAENQFADRKLNFIDYGRILRKIASRQLKLDLTNPIHQNDFPNLVRIAILSKIETDVQKQSAHIEKEKAVLKSKLKGFEWKTEGLNRRFFENLYGASRKSKVSLDQFPAFKQWAEYEILKSEIEASALFSEIEVLEKRIYDSLIRNAEERNLVNRSQNFRNTEKFARLEVTREEYEKFQFGGENEIKSLVQEAKQFYALALQRESALLSNLLKKAREQKLSKVVLVTGGFHTAGIEGILKSQKISHVTITPKITNEDKSGNYLRVILDKIPAPLPTGDIVNPLRTQQLVGSAKSLGLRKSNPIPDDGDVYPAQLLGSGGTVPVVPSKPLEKNKIYTVRETDTEDDLDVILTDSRFSEIRISNRLVLLKAYLSKQAGLKSSVKNSTTIFMKINASSLGMVDFSGVQLDVDAIRKYAEGPIGLEAGRLALEGEKSLYPTPSGALVPRFGYKDSVDGVLSARAAKNREGIKQWTAEQKAKGRKVMLHFGIGGQGMSNSVQVDYWGEQSNNLVIVVDRLGTSMKELFDNLIKRGYKASEIVLDTSSKSGTTDETLIFYQAAFLELIKRLGVEKGIEDEAKALAGNFVSFFKKFNDGKDKADLFANVPQAEFEAAFNPVQRELLKEVFDHLIFTTSKNPNDSRLYAFVEGMKNIAPIAVFDFSEYTGGRFTDNSESALVTDAWRGIDIDSLIQSLEPAAQNYLGEKGNDPEINFALRAAIATHLKDPSIIVVAVRSPNALSEALQKVQLFPESNGKSDQGAFVVAAVGEIELNTKVQKIMDETGKAPFVIMVDYPEGKYEGLKPLALTAELAAKTPYLRYIKENISPESNARFALWFQEYTIRYGLLSAAKMSVATQTQFEIPKVGASGMNKIVLDGKPNRFALIDPQNQRYVELAKGALVNELSKWDSIGQKSPGGMKVRYFHVESQVKPGAYVDKSSFGGSSKGASGAEDSGLYKLHQLGIQFAGAMTGKLESTVTDQQLLNGIREVKYLKGKIKSYSAQLFEAVRINNHSQIASIQKNIEDTHSQMRAIYESVKEFGKEKPDSQLLEQAAQDLAILMLIARQGIEPKIFSPIFYSHRPEADILGEFFGFIDYGIGTRDQHANFQHRLDGRDVTFNLLVDVVTPYAYVVDDQEPVAAYGLAKDYLDGVHPDEVRRLFLEQEYKALTGAIGIDTLDEKGSIVKDKTVRRSAAILRIQDIGSDEGLMNAIRLFARARVLYEHALKAQQSSGRSLGVSQVFEFLTQHPGVLVAATAVAAGAATIFLIQSSERYRSIRTFNFKDEEERNKVEKKLNELRKALRRSGFNPDDVFESGLFQLVPVAKNTAELMLFLDLGVQLASEGISPNSLYYHVIPKLFPIIHNDSDLAAVLITIRDAAVKLKKSGGSTEDAFVTEIPRIISERKAVGSIVEEVNRLAGPVMGKSLGTVVSEPVIEGQHKSILKFEDIKPGEVAFGRYDKLIPLTVNFARTYGGSKPQYQWLRELADVLEGFTVIVGKPEKMPAPYADYERRNKKIVLDKDFVDFLFMTGRKKIAMAWLIDLAHHIKYSKPMDDEKTNLVCGSKKSLTSLEEKTRLDDTLYIYKIKEKIAKNDTPEGPEVPTRLTERNVLLIISDYLHRGRILDAPRLQRMLRREFGFYGNFPVEKISELLEKFYESHKDKMMSRPVTTKDDIENLKKKLAETANISLADIASKETKTIRYSFKREYMTDPAFKNRLTVWDVEVERQDEVDFGGKTAHTGELMFAPRAVTLENFATGSQGFQALINYNTTKIFTDNLRKNIEALRKLIHREDSVHDKVIDLLSLTTEELTHEASNGNKGAEILMTELTMLRVILDAESKAIVRKQLEAVMEGYSIVLYDLEHYKYKVSGIRDYFNQLGKSLDELVTNIKAKKLNVEKQIELAKTRLDDLRKEEKIIVESKPEDEFGRHGKDKKLAGKTKEIEGKIAEIKALETLELHYQKEFEEVTLKNANRFLYAARNLVVPPDLDKEIKDNLKLLAQRLGLPVEKLVLAIRSSAVGEDSEEASFAGRQDTYIFQTATPKDIAAQINKDGLLKVDEDGLDNFVTSWVFNQASLFNKRAIDYRFDKGLPTFDNHVEISTLFQRMFLSKYSFIAFSVDRGTAFPSMSMNIHEGQGEMLVSGQESGSKYVVSLDGETVIVRDKGERNLKVVETEDRMGKQKIPLTAEERKEFSVTDEELVKASAAYFASIDDFYDEGFVDLEGAYRPKEDANLKSIPLKSEGKILKDHRGFDRMDWNIVSTQARPETVYSLQDPSVIKLKKIMVTDAAFEKAERERKVMDFKFIARTEGTAQGEVSWVHDKTNPEELAKVKGKIMVARQSDPDMNSAMLSAKGIIAILGGQNSHTMIVASEYGLVAITGTSEQLQEYLKEGMEVTIDAERGKILLGYDHELKVAGRDFSAREIPDTAYGTARSSTIVASRDKAMFQHPLRNIPSYKGVGLKRMEIDLAFIETYTDALLAYDNMILQEKGGKVTEGQTLDRKEDEELIKFIEEKIAGFNSGRDFYETVIREGILATAEPLNPDDDEVRLRYQQIQNKELRLTVKDIVDKIYKEGLGHNSDRLLVALRILYDAQTPGSLEHKLLEEISGLLDKRLYVRLDDRKSDEYKNVKGAEKFVKEELNAMKGFRGLSLLLSSPTLKWQLKVMIDVAKLHRHKIAIFAPIVRRPEDFKKLIEKFLEVGKELGISSAELANLVEIGMMTEIPTNSVYMEDYLKVVQDFRDQGIPIRFFTSTGGNDGLQTIYKIDRNTGDAELKNNATAYGPAVIRWNSRIPSQQKKFNKDKIEAMKAAVQAKDRDAAYKYLAEIVEAGYCGNDPSVRGQEEYGRGLSALGYKSVSVVIEAYEKVAKNLAVADVKELGATAIPRYERFEKEKDFDFEIDPAAKPKTQDYVQVNIGDILLGLGVHYRLLADYDAGKLTDEKGQVLADEVKKLLRAKGYSAHEEGVGMKYFHDAVQEKLEAVFVEAQKSGKKLVIGTDDALTSSHIEDGEKFGGMRGLLGGDRYESLEANPDYGFAGLVKNVTRDREFFKRELDIIWELKSAYPDVKTGITLRLVRTFTDINEALAVMKEARLIKNISLFETPSKHGFRLALKVLEEAGLVKFPENGKDPIESALAVLEKRSMIRGENRDITDEKMLGLLEKMSIALKINPKKTDLKAIMEKLKETGFVGGVPQKGDTAVGLDVQVTANLFEIKEILDPVRRIQFLSIPDAEELTGEMMALERKNVNNDVISADDIRYQTKKPIQILATAAEKRGISFTLSAEELKKTEFAKPEDSEGQKQTSASSLGDSAITLEVIKALADKRRWNIEFKNSQMKADDRIRIEAVNISELGADAVQSPRKKSSAGNIKPGLIITLPQGREISGQEVMDAILSAIDINRPYFASIRHALLRIKEVGLRASEEEMSAFGSSLGTRAEMKLVNRPEFTIGYTYFNPEKPSSSNPDTLKLLHRIFYSGQSFSLDQFGSLLEAGESVDGIYKFIYRNGRENEYGFLLKDGSVLPVLYEPIKTKSGILMLRRGEKRFEGPGTGKNKSVEERAYEMHQNGPDFIQEESHFKPSIVGNPYFWLRSDLKDVRKVEPITEKTTFHTNFAMGGNLSVSHFDSLLTPGEEPVAFYVFQKATNQGVVTEDVYGILLKDGSVLPFDMIKRIKGGVRVSLHRGVKRREGPGTGVNKTIELRMAEIKETGEASSLGNALYLQDGVDSLLGDLRIDNAGKLRQLVITGPVKLENATLIGDVRIENLSGKSVDLNADPYKKQLPNKAGGGLMLIDISIRIDANGGMSVDKDVAGASLGIRKIANLPDGSEISFIYDPQALPEEARPYWDNHFGIFRIQNEKIGFTAYASVHKASLVNGKVRTIGGTRIRHYENEAEAIKDGLRLSKAMSYKSAGANLPIGGSKIDINVPFDPLEANLTPETREKKNQVLASVAAALEKIGFFSTGQDMNISVENAKLMFQHAPTQIIPYAAPGSEAPTPPTADGVINGIKAAIEVIHGGDSIDFRGKTISLQGLGGVGRLVLAGLLKDGFVVYATDVFGKTREEMKVLYADQIRSGQLFVVEPDAIYDAPAEVFSPSAKEDMVYPSVIDRLEKAGVKAIVGSANNPLQDEERDSKLLVQKGILYAPDYVVNAGGLIGVARGIFLGTPGAYEVKDKVHSIYTDTKRLLKVAIENGVSPLEVANQRNKKRIDELSSLSAEDYLKKLEQTSASSLGERSTTILSNGENEKELRKITNDSVRSWVREMTAFTGADSIEVIDASDDDRLLEEEVASGKLIKLPDGNYYANSHPKDVARSEERTIVSTKNPEDKGINNNWKKSDAPEKDGETVTFKEKVKGLVKDSMVGKKMYVVPYLMGPVGSEFAQVGIEVTDSRYVALNMIRMTKVGKAALEHLGTSDKFLKGVHSTGNLEQIHKDIADKGIDNRYFTSFPDDREIWSYGSAYGGNALLGKKFHSLRQAGYDARNEGWLAEHMAIVEIENLKTGEKKYVAAAFPSASGKTNFAMMKPPAALEKDYAVRVVGDDIAWLRVGKDGRLRAINPENGYFGVVPGTNYETNPAAMDSIRGGTKTLFTNVAINEKTGELWWESKTKTPPADIDGWKDWQGKYIKDRKPEDMNKPWAHPNSRFTTSAVNAPNVSSAFNDPDGVPISAIFWGGRLKDREPLIRQLHSSAEGIYDGLVMGVEATAAADGKAGQFRPDPNAMKPFFSYRESQYARHWLETMSRLGKNAPTFFHVNWFRKGTDGRWLWPGYGENLRMILWALDRAEGKGGAIDTPIGFMPRKEDLNLEGLNIPDADISELLSVDAELWKKEAERREEFLKTLDKNRLPLDILSVHNHFVQEISKASSLGEDSEPVKELEKTPETITASSAPATVQPVVPQTETKPYDPFQKLLEDYKPGELRPRTDNILGSPKKESAATREGILDRKPSPSGTRNLFVGRGKNVDGKRTDNILGLPKKTPNRDRNIRGKSLGSDWDAAAALLDQNLNFDSQKVPQGLRQPILVRFNTHYSAQNPAWLKIATELRKYLKTIFFDRVGSGENWNIKQLPQETKLGTATANEVRHIKYLVGIRLPYEIKNLGGETSEGELTPYKGASLGEDRSLEDVVGTIKELAGRIIGNEVPDLRSFLFNLVFGAELTANASEDDSLKTLRGEHSEYVRSLPDSIYANAHQQQPELGVLATTSDLYTPEIERQLKLNPKALAVIVFTGPLRDLNSFKQKFAGVSDRVIIEPASTPEAGSVMNKILTGSALRKLAGNVKQTELARHTSVFAPANILNDLKGLKLATRLVARHQAQLAEFNISPADFNLFANTVGFLIAKKGGYDALNEDLREGLSRPDGNNWVQFNLGLLGAKIAQLAQEFAGFQAVLRAA